MLGRASVARQGARGAARRRSLPLRVSAVATKEVWVETTSKAAALRAVEALPSVTLVFAEGTGGERLREEWSRSARFDAAVRDDEGGGAVVDARGGARLGRVVGIQGPDDVAAAAGTLGADETLVFEPRDSAWSIIPAENLVAAAVGTPTKVFGAVSSAEEAQVMLEALEVGCHGVLLKTDDEAQITALGAYLRSASGGSAVALSTAVVTKVEPAGMGDRVAVDCAANMEPGEGMLVGSFAAGLFLVHSECLESEYVASRAFRVNAGAVCSYMMGPGERTTYLSEVSCGTQALVVDATGAVRTTTVGRAKVEARPMMLVEARAEGSGNTYAVLLQNAETVRLIGPAEAYSSDAERYARVRSGAGVAVSVAELAPGDVVLVAEGPEARHTGIKVEERIVEK